MMLQRSLPVWEQTTAVVLGGNICIYWKDNFPNLLHNVPIYQKLTPAFTTKNFQFTSKMFRYTASINIEANFLGAKKMFDPNKYFLPKTKTQKTRSINLVLA